MVEVLMAAETCSPDGLDITRRYLVPVASLKLADTPVEVHLSLYTWAVRIDEWVTGLSLCGASVEQGALPAGTTVTCVGCLQYEPVYRQWLEPKAPLAEGNAEAIARATFTRLRQMTDAWKQQLPDTIRTQTAAEAIQTVLDTAEAQLRALPSGGTS
jgi:hypothetical protein